MSTVFEQPQLTVAHDGAPADAPAPVLADVETRLMHNYRVAAPVHAGSVVAAVPNGSGDVELFSLGSDGTVWCFYPDPTSESGYNGVSLGLQATTFAVGRGSDGRLVLWYSSVLQLSYVKETGLASSRWSQPVTVSYPAVPNQTRIGGIFVDDIAGQLYVGLLVQYHSAGGDYYALEYSIWSEVEPTFQRTKMTVDSLCCTWVGSSAQTAALACLSHIIVAYEVATATVARYPMTGTFEAISASAATDASGNTQIVAVLGDGNAYHLIGGSGGQSYSWVQISVAKNFRQIAADTDAAGNVHAFAVSGDNKLHHWQPESSGQTGFSDPSVISAGVSALAAAADDGGALDLFAIGTAQSTLTHLFQEEVSTNWTAEQVEVPQGGQLEEFVSYTSDVSLTDAAGALLANAPVELSATQEAYVAVNGAVFFVGPHHCARTSTNAAGVISIAQPTGSLAIPGLALNVTGRLSPGATIALEQHADVQQRLKDVSGPELMQAKDADGEYLLADKYRTPATTDSLASAFAKCMALPDRPTTQVLPLSGRHRSNTGVGTLLCGSVADLRALPAPAAAQHWRLAFADGAAAYEDLTAESAHALLAEWRATTQSATGILDWLSDIGDFVSGVVDGVISIVETIVTTVGGAVKAAFKFIVDGIEYLFDAIVTFVEEAFDVVEAFFAQVGVFFQKLFEWLGFIFNWPDMVRTHEALAYTLNEFLTFLQGAVVGTQRIVDDGIGSLKGEIRQFFNEAIEQIAGSSSVGTYEQSNRPPSPELSAATANNVVYNGTVNNAAGARTVNALLAVDTSPFEAIISELETFATSTRDAQAFADAKQYFTNLGGKPDEIFTQLLSGLMRVAEGVLEAILSGVQAVVDALLGVVATLVGLVQQMLNEEWDIPLVSQLYSWATDGSKLTMLDLISLMAAIPTTIVYKAAYEAAPFPDAAAVDAFKKSFDAQSMLNAAGFGTAPSAALAETDSGGLLSKEMARLMATGCGVSTIFFGGFTAIIDAFPKDSPQILNQATFGLECAAQVFSLPWWTSSAKPDCSTPDGKQATLWVYCNVGIAMDGVVLLAEKRLPPNWDDIGCVMTFSYGIGHLIVAIIASIGKGGLEVAGNILPVIPELSKLLRLTSVIEATEGISLPVIAGIDGLFYGAAGVIAAVAPAVTELELH